MAIVTQIKSDLDDVRVSSFSSQSNYSPTGGGHDGGHGGGGSTSTYSTNSADIITLTDTTPTSGDGDIFVDAGGGDDLINITAGTDGDSSSSDIFGGSGNDTMLIDYTTAIFDKDDDIHGGSGNDFISVTSGDDTDIWGDTGTDHIKLINGYDGEVNGSNSSAQDDGSDQATDIFEVTGFGNRVFIDDWHWDGRGSADDQLIIDGVNIDLASLFGDGVIGSVISRIDNGNTAGITGADTTIYTVQGSVIGLDHASVNCFVEGTQIATPAGEVAVETLAIGDEVTTAEGKTAAIKWMGYREVSATFAKKNAGAQPVLITAGALGNSLPTADLRVSPEHAMLIDGVLVHAEALVNDATIVREAIDHTFTYYHVELEQHDLVLANGAAAETFVDAQARGKFDNAAEFEALYPTAKAVAAMPLPRVKSKRQLPAAIKAKLGQAKTA